MRNFVTHLTCQRECGKFAMHFICFAARSTSRTPPRFKQAICLHLSPVSMGSAEICYAFLTVSLFGVPRVHRRVSNRQSAFSLSVGGVESLLCISTVSLFGVPRVHRRVSNRQSAFSLSESAEPFFTTPSHIKKTAAECSGKVRKNA